LRDLLVLVVQHDPTVSSRIEDELGSAGVRVAGPVADLEHASARAEGQVLSAVLLDVDVPRGASAVTGFLRRHPGIPVIATAPRRAEAEARRAVKEGARLYLLDEEIGRGILAPLVRHVAGEPGPGRAVEDAESPPPARRLLHDLGNLLSVVSGESEMLVGRVREDDPLAADIHALHDAITESVRTFRKFVASRRTEALEPRPGAPT
jgi:CheY-like chemotaxis protein